MQTYYQKHRQIRAFQFDGTWQQLKQELPPSIFESLIHEFDNIIPDYATSCDLDEDDNRILQIRSFSHGWPINSVRHGTVLDLDGQVLHLNDYVVCYYYMTHYHDTPGNKKMTYVGSYQLKFYHDKDFEAHWKRQF